jgi:hypothetical protein
MLLIMKKKNFFKQQYYSFHMISFLIHETIVPCDQMKKGENGGLNQSKHQNNTMQVLILLQKL